jgi:arginase
MGIDAAARAAVDHLTRHPLGGFFIHVDADSLSDSVMPAVDYRLADGLTWDELATVLRVALSSGRAAGLEVTIYNPALDESGAAGRGLVETLARALDASAHNERPQADRASSNR